MTTLWYKYIHVRSYKSYDPICFKREVEQLPLHHVNSKLDLFNGLFLNTLNRPAPMKYKKKTKEDRRCQVYR